MQICVKQPLLAKTSFDALFVLPYDVNDARLTAIFENILGKPVLECLYSGFY